MISEHTILSYFAQVSGSGWTLAGGSLTSGWRAFFKGKYHDFESYLDIDAEWVYLQCPLLRLEASDACKKRLYEALLRFSDRMFLAKFTLFKSEAQSPAQDWVALSVECPVGVFDAAMFRIMTDAVATYAEQYDQEVQVLAQDERVNLEPVSEKSGGRESHVLAE